MTMRPLTTPASFRRSPDPQWDWRELCAFCHAVARSYARRPDIAEDAAQEAIARAWRFRRSCEGADSRPWVAAIVRREVLRAAADRRERVVSIDATPHALSDADADGESASILRADQRATVRSALGRLMERDRQLLLLRYGVDLTQPQIARVLDIPEGTVKIRLHRARARLREELEPSAAEPGAAARGGRARR